MKTHCLDVKGIDEELNSFACFDRVGKYDHFAAFWKLVYVTDHVFYSLEITFSKSDEL